MRQETNNEIDLLLRRMSRQDGGSVGNGKVHDQHLDVDELSSYAQNALPAAARARYTEHLAECSTCRKLVTELSLSLGATAVAAPVETIAGPSALKKFLASLFSPMVLRYAVPALGLIIVAAIGFAIFRDRGQNTFVAKLDDKQNAPLTTSPEAAAPSASPDSAVNNSAKPEQSRATPEPKEIQSKSLGGVPDAAGGLGPAPAATPAQEVAASAPQPSVAAEPPPAKVAESKPAKIDAVTEAEEQRKEEQKNKDAVAKKEPSTGDFQAAETRSATPKANEPGRDYNRGAKPAGAADRADESKRENVPLQRGVSGIGNVSRSRPQTKAQTDKDDAETRTVSGRRFRKERGIWTDTAYDSSTATVNMARGSEQFRALIADEPEIKKIAEQLDGEVIVVWKGRAYRIR